MKTVIRFLLVCLIALSPVLGRAESGYIEHDFNEMFNASPKKLTVDGSVGTTDFVTYTCSGGAKFFYYGPAGSQELAIFLVYGKAGTPQVEISQIQNLDSISINFTPKWENNYNEVLNFEIYDAEKNEWKNLLTNYQTSTQRTLKLPKVGDYRLRISRKSTDIYIRSIEYFCRTTPDCPNCFVYTPE